MSCEQIVYLQYKLFVLCIYLHVCIHTQAIILITTKEKGILLKSHVLESDKEKERETNSIVLKLKKIPNVFCYCS